LIKVRGKQINLYGRWFDKRKRSKRSIRDLGKAETHLESELGSMPNFAASNSPSVTFHSGYHSPQRDAALEDGRRGAPSLPFWVGGMKRLAGRDQAIRVSPNNPWLVSCPSPPPAVHPGSGNRWSQRSSQTDGLGIQFSP